mgnify:CR=1 FL=1
MTQQIGVNDLFPKPMNLGFLVKKKLPQNREFEQSDIKKG